VNDLKAKYSDNAADIDRNHESADTYVVTTGFMMPLRMDRVAVPVVPRAPDVKAFGSGRPKKAKKYVHRKAFAYKVTKAIRIKRGQHRRHIISNHLMISAINAWIKAHGASKRVITWLQRQADRLNENPANLHPGAGAANSAIGMFTNAVESKLERASASVSDYTPSELSATLAASLGNYTGFQQMEQKRLIGPALEPLKRDLELITSPGAALTYGQDLQDSTDFDWPEGADPDLYKSWQEMYTMFLNVKNAPQGWSWKHLLGVFDRFMALPDPVRE
jgi:hypothetical protein